jgi:protein transport protein SEC24
MRVRATRGIRFSAFYGNYFVRGADLLALPNCSADSSFSLDMAYDETVLSAQATQPFLVNPHQYIPRGNQEWRILYCVQAITVQAALLYTSAAGERRIRVHTMVIPVTQVRD